jgi:hypothetical protein
MNEDEVNQSNDEQGVIGSSNDDRVARLNAIADQTDAGRADEFANVNDDGSTEPYTVAAEQAETDDTTVSDEQSTGDEAATSTSAEPKRYRIKVNGKELELTEAELIERAQKIEAADDYLRQAAEARRKLEQIARPEVDEAEIRRRQDEEDRALVRAIQVGTEEEATVALRKLREQTSARPSLSRDDVSRTIDERLAFNQAIEKFSSEYTDVWSDPILKKIALDRDAQLLKDGDQRAYWERYSSIGEEIRNWKQSLAPAPKQETVIEDKVARKASAPKVPAPASAKAKPAKVEEDDVDDSPASVIASMAQRRGGPQWMRS